jgi:hypothetical protein
MKTIRHNFHVPLSEELYRLLRTEAERVQQPATVVAHNAIAWWLEQRAKETLHDSIRAYAEHHAGTDVDLDPDLEQAIVEHLLAEEPND